MSLAHTLPHRWQEPKHIAKRIPFAQKKIPKSSLFATPSSPDQLRHLDTLLPEPSRTLSIGDTSYSLFQAKRLTQNAWTHPALAMMVQEARMAYRAYGNDIPLVDAYDHHSAIYLARAIYPEMIDGHMEQVEEWASIRFVHAYPLSTEDLDFYVCRIGKKGYTVLDALRMKTDIFRSMSIQNIKKHIATHSRVCVIRPFLREQKKPHTPSSAHHEHLGRKNKTFALSFALMNSLFLEDMEKEHIPIDMLTSQMHRRLTDTILSLPVKAMRKIVTLPFTDAATILGLPDTSDVLIDRRKPGVYAYKYPSYFLDVTDLAKTVLQLVRKGKIRHETLQEYITENTSIHAALAQPKMATFRNFGALLTQNGRINGDTITGSQLRAILDTEVRDGPVLRLMMTPVWKKAVRSFIDHAKTYA